MDEQYFSLPNIADGEDKSHPLANKIRNTYRHLRKWAKRTLTNAFRIYDREIVQYPLAIDFYDGRFCVQYFARSQDDEGQPPTPLVDEVERALKTVFGSECKGIYWRARMRSKKTRQYEKIGSTSEFFTVLEYGVKFSVNLVEYLDTGLFLDHRETRQLLASLAQGKRVLNLFAYTCSFSIHAAVRGALLTKSVDMSNTYTAWGRDNFLLNSLPSEKNIIVRADCLKFVTEELKTGTLYDLIIVDPPTISRSKKMDQLFDVQQDYIPLLSKTLQLLAPQGTLFFSTNSRKFAFDASAFAHYTVQEISHKTVPVDFHDKKIHRCWKITAKN